MRAPATLRFRYKCQIMGCPLQSHYIKGPSLLAARTSAVFALCAPGGFAIGLEALMRRTSPYCRFGSRAVFLVDARSEPVSAPKQNSLNLRAGGRQPPGGQRTCQPADGTPLGANTERPRWRPRCRLSSEGRGIPTPLPCKDNQPGRVLAFGCGPHHPGRFPLPPSPPLFATRQGLMHGASPPSRELIKDGGLRHGQADKSPETRCL